MARPRKEQPAAATNGYDEVVLTSIVKKLDENTATLASAKGAYMKKAQDIGNQRKNIFEEAKARGIPVKQLKAAIKKRDLLDKAADVLAEFEDEGLEEFEKLSDALGWFADTPLGAAAISADEQRKRDADAFDSLGGDAA